MSDEPDVGVEPHTRQETVLDKKHTPCVSYEQPVAENDARQAATSNTRRARLRADGGGSPSTTSPPDPTAWFAEDRPALLDLNAFRRDLFVVTALYGTAGESDTRPNGLDIKRTMESLCGRTVYGSQLYPAFHDLIDADLLRTDPRHQDVNHYVVTEHGCATLWEYASLVRAAARSAGPPDHSLATASDSETNGARRGEAAIGELRRDDRDPTGGEP